MQSLSIFLILMIIFQFSGCAKTTSTATTSTAPVPPIPDAGALPAHKTQSELRVGAEPTFGQDIGQKGLLPVMVFLQNNGAQPLKVTPNLISLEFQDGGEVKANSLPTALLPAPAPPPPDTTGAKVARVAARTGLFVLFSACSMPVSPWKSAAEIQEEKLQKELQITELREVTLAKDESAQGFVYFYIPQGVQHAVGAHLIVPYLPAQGRGGKVRIPLTRM